MQCCLQDQIGRNIETYFNNIIVKSTKAKDLIKDISKTFASLWKFNIKLNPEKYTFGRQTARIHLFSTGNRSNQVKVNAILNMGPPRELKDTQKLMGCLASITINLV